MNPNKYKNQINKSISNIGLPKEFDYDNFPFVDNKYKELIEYFITFSQQNLEKSCGIIGRNSFIYIVDDINVNAFATSTSGRGVIGINHGAILELYNTIVKSPNDFNLMDYFTYQIVILFLFYHEKAHLIQGKNGNAWLINEMTSSGDYNQTKHLREFDADIYAVSLILAHIEEFSIKYKYSLEKLIASTIAGIYILCMKFAGGNTQFYLKDKSHPHGKLRMLYITTQLIRNIQTGNIMDLTEIDLVKQWQMRLFGILDQDEQVFNQEMIEFRNYQPIMENYILELNELWRVYTDSAGLNDPKLSVRYGRRPLWQRITIDRLNELLCSKIK